MLFTVIASSVVIFSPKYGKYLVLQVAGDFDHVIYPLNFHLVETTFAAARHFLSECRGAVGGCGTKRH